MANYDIYKVAGANAKATYLSFTTTASGGSGISLQLVSDTFPGPVISGFEISAGDCPVGTRRARASTCSRFALTTRTSWSHGGNHINRWISEGRGSFVWTPTAATNGDTAPLDNAAWVANNTAATTSAAAGPFLIAPLATLTMSIPILPGVTSPPPAEAMPTMARSPATPLSSILAVLNAYHPGVGATIFVDSGTLTSVGEHRPDFRQQRPDHRRHSQRHSVLNREQWFLR